VENAVKKSGRLVKAPENFLAKEDIKSPALMRRKFLAASVTSAAASMAAMGLAASPRSAVANVGAGDPNILNLPEHTTGLGLPVAANAYGLPSKYEKGLQRRESPGLTRVSAASVAFTPLQGTFGIITPSGLHFERHHQGWWDIDPSKHRFMVNGLVKNPKVYTMDDIMRLPSVSRIHFIECGANTAMEWGNHTPCPRVANILVCPFQ